MINQWSRIYTLSLFSSGGEKCPGKVRRGFLCKRRGWQEAYIPVERVFELEKHALIFSPFSCLFSKTQSSIKYFLV